MRGEGVRGEGMRGEVVRGNEGKEDAYLDFLKGAAGDCIAQ